MCDTHTFHNYCSIKSIRLSHDVTDIKGYIIEEDNSSMVYITDTGYINENIFKYILK